MNRVSDNYADGLEIRIKELIAERDALAAKLAGIEVQLTQAFVHTAKLALQEPVAYEIEATRFANGKQLTYDKPSNLPGYITYRPLYAALSAAPAPQAQECTRSHPHELMDGCCELRTELARLTNENAILKAAPQPAQGERIAALQSAQPVAQPMRELTDEEVKAAAIEIAFIVWPDTGYVGWTDDDKVFFREFTRTVLKKARE